MINLIKADFYRAKKDKILLIGLCVSIGLVLMQALLMKGLIAASGAADADTEQVAAVVGTTGLSMFLNGVSILGNTTQYIIPIFLTIFVVREFSDKTIRNKLILGYTRPQIYASILIVHAVISLVYYLATSLIGLISGALLFGLGVKFSADVFGLLVIGFILEFFLSYILIGFAIIFAINKQSVALGILIPLIVGFIISILGAVAILNINPTLTKILSFFNFYQASEIQGMKGLSDIVVRTAIEMDDSTYYLPLTPLARILIITPIAITAEIVIGYFKFKHIQFK